MGKLIKLELYNFKSYKGHHELLFGDAYFTSIIGPNGSGKSNSMDAISFVLGIKSSHLRSSHLRDLVYRGRVLKTSRINDDGSAAAPATNGHANGDGNGSDEEGGSQRPARNDPKSAWVMAVYEDDAGEEHRWKRSITNSGSSEYRINERVVTAQQYNDALEAENILIKARNFLVFQGDVEAIASQSPKDLTRLIEQISGSLEYKAEYERLEEEADKAAEDQNYNLQRRRGMNSEIKQYQEQKREAENYQNKTDERDNAIVTHILWKLYHFQRVMEESSASIQEHHENLKEYRRGVEKYQKNLEDARKDADRVSKSISETERKIKRKEKDIEGKEDQIVSKDELIEQQSKRIETNTKRLEGEIASQQQDALRQVEKFKKDLAAVEKAQKHFEVESQKKLAKQGKELSEADFKQYTALRSQVIAKTSDDQSEWTNLMRQLKTDEVTANSLKGKMEAIEAKIEKLQSAYDKTLQRRDNAKVQVKQITKDIEAKKNEFNTLQSTRVHDNQRYSDKDGKLQEALRKLGEANDGHRRNDREARQRETIGSLKHLFPKKVHGRIGDLYKAKQKKYDQAIIVALGRDFDSIVVDTEKTGTECVQYLKERRLPPMTFIPLDTIKVNAVNSNLKGLPKARLTIDTIDFDSVLERAMSYACGSSIVCDDLDTAKHICYQRNIQVKAVTLEGFVIHKAGLMTGGQGPERLNKRKSDGRDKYDSRDVEALTTLVNNLTAELERIPKPSSRSSEEEKCQVELAGLQQNLEYQKRELAALEQNLASQKKELDFAERELSEIRPRAETKSVEVEKLRQKVVEFREAIDKVEDKIFSDFCKRLDFANIRDYEEQQGRLEQEAQETKNAHARQKQTLTSQLKWQTDALEDWNSRAQRVEGTLAKDREALAALETERRSLENSIEEIRGAITELEDEFHKLKEKHMAKNEKVTAARNELAKRSKEIETLTKEITGLETEARRNSSSRYALLRRCKLEQIAIPLAEGSKKLDSLPVDENMQQPDDDAMDLDESEEPEDDIVKTYGIDVDFDDLGDDLRNPDEEDVEEQLQEKISSLNAELEKLNPNMRAIDRLDGVEARLKTTEKEFEDSRKAAKASRDKFNEVKAKRYDLFNKAFSHISEQITHVYKDLTRSATYPLGGQAYLNIEDSDAPYLSGIKYHAMPPLKRFRDMEHLSGGEKTMAALALLFAVHSYQPSPFFVLDEVDAALDNANVEKIRNYIREHAGPGMQFIVISLKTGLFQGSESLVGVFRDQEANSSKTLTLDLRKYV